jgi:uncharacterized membrane protein
MIDPISKPLRRIVFVDVLRLLAAFQMIQGHSIDAVLAPTYRAGSFFRAWTFVRGLTSTTFLVTAGLSFVLATAAARDPGAARKHRLRRALLLIGTGYLLHAPLGIFFGADVGTALREASVVDVLQCIGTSLIMLELLQRISKPALRGGAALALGILCFLLAPWLDLLSPEGPSRVFTNYLSAGGGSLFPWLPWSGYVLCGFAVGLFALSPARASGLDRARALGLTAILALAAGALLAVLMPGFPQRISPAFGLLKLGVVLTLASALAWLLRDTKRLPNLLTRLSAETLFLYVSHVFVLYAAHVGIAARWGKQADPLQGALLAGVLLVACGTGALGYRAGMRALRQRGGEGTPAPERAETTFPPG